MKKVDRRGADGAPPPRTAAPPPTRSRRVGRAPRFAPPPPGAAVPMRRWPHVVRALLAAIFFALDALFARLAVEVNAAGALLSPGGAVALEALLVAGLFALTRLAFVTTLALTAGSFAAALVDRLLARAFWAVRRTDAS